MGLMGWKRPLLRGQQMSCLIWMRADEGGDRKAEQEADITIVVL